MTSELLNALKGVADERSMKVDDLVAVIEEAVKIVAVKRLNRENLEVRFDRARGEFELYEILEVAEEPSDPSLQISLDRAVMIAPEASVGSTVKNRVEMEDLGRIAAQSVRQMIHKKGREAELHHLFLSYSARKGQVVTARFIRKTDAGLVFELGELEGVVPHSEQLANDRFERGRHVKLAIAEVAEGRREPMITLSRIHPNLLTKLMENESPELADGTVEVVNVARDGSGRSKVVVKSRKHDIDPVGACIGPHGARIKPVMKELSGEKIDIIGWSEDPKKLITAALAPAKSMKVLPSDKIKFADVIVPDGELSLAIGKRGVNVKLAVKVTRWDLDVMNQKEYEEKMARIEKNSGERAPMDQKDTETRS
ncbi:MAG: transcription termination/antitermination protein NusA [Nitrospinae bacterium]|nr:transcription termination/antitermination protein NusA [Nitrospinota bacterium]